MKKMIFGFVAVLALATSVSVLASAHSDDCAMCDQASVMTHVSSSGTNCNGIVGCRCPGFSPITNGDVWQQAYCRHCNHKKSVHK